MNELRDFAGQEASERTTIISLSGYSKEGKSVETPVESRTLQRWGTWTGSSGYFDGRNIASGLLGIDYRLKPHWLIGAYATFWYDRHSLFQGGLYTAWSEKNWWGVLGTQLGYNDYTGFASTGYDFRRGSWLFGPVVSFQFDSQPVDHGFGRGNLLQTRVGGRVAYTTGRITLELQAMYERQSINNAPNRANALWLGLGVNYSITDRWSVYGAYSLDANSEFQEHQIDIGCRYLF